MRIDVTSAFKGFTQPLDELIDDLHRRGWTLAKLDIKDKDYLAEGKSPHGEKLNATGNTEATAVANLIVKVMRREWMRSSAIKEKLGAWDFQPIEQQFAQIAIAYAGAPVYDPKAATAWMELAQDFQRRAQIIKTQISIEYTNDPISYESANDLREDVTKKRHVLVTRAYSHHPVWSESQMLDYRLVVDVLGHTLGGGDWGWHGTCLAFAQLAPLLTENPQKALFTELLGQAAFGQFYRQWGPQKIAFLDDLIEKEQQKENQPGHHGVHPSQSIVPMMVPRIGAMTRTQLLQRAQEFPQDQSGIIHQWPDGWTIRQPQTYGDLHREGSLMGNCWTPFSDDNNVNPPWDAHPLAPDDADWPYTPSDLTPEILNASLPEYCSGMRSLRDPDNVPHMSFYHDTRRNAILDALGRHNDPPKPEYMNRVKEWAGQNGAHMRFAAIVGSPKDPNEGWESGVSPLQDNAYLWQRQDGVDPLDIQSAQESLYPLESGIANMHPGLMRQAVVNALRGSLLGARQSPRNHAIHYQTLASLPADVDDPMAYHDALEQAREHWNTGQGYAPESHKQYWPQEQQLKQWVKATNPHLDDGEVNRVAKRELVHMLMEEEERVIATDEGEQLTAEQIEHEAYEAIKNRLKALTKPNVDQKVDFGDTHLWHEATFHADMYPPYLASRLRPLAQISRNATALAEAAREDLAEHGGRGHRFRSAVLSLGIPGIGPRQTATAWLHLAPQTSQLGIVDPHIAEILGHDYSQMSNRDYFKHERELQAARDASGYNHIPLGAFSTALWDQKAGGPGWHPDRTPYRAYSPTPYGSIDWNAQVPILPDWPDPYWWNSTQEARDQAGQEFDRSLGTEFGRDEIPFQKTAARQVMYHHTPAGNAANIEQYGLQTQHDFNYDPEDPDSCGGIYLTTHPTPDPGSAVYEVNTEGLPIEPDPTVGPGTGGMVTDPAGTEWYVSYEDIPPDRLRRIAASEGRAPWVVHPQTGERVTGPPGTSLMQHLKGVFGHPTVQDVWDQDYQVGKE